MFLLIVDEVNSTDIFCHLMLYNGYGTRHTCGPYRSECFMFDFSRRRPKNFKEWFWGVKHLPDLSYENLEDLKKK